MNKILVSPSILSADFAALGQDVQKLQQAGADWVHVDVMDGNFVPNISIGPGVVSAIRPYSTLPFDVHLMIEKPLSYIEAFAKAGADYITVHTETVKDPLEAVQSIHRLGKKAGLTVSPDTPVSAIAPAIELVDLILIMTVYPGFGGQSYLHKCTPKIKEAAQMANNAHREIIIQADGGINATTVKEVIDAGANCIVAGSAVFGKKDMQQAIEGLRA